MRIGYSVEGSTDRALLKGLKERWCPRAELVEGSFRGRTGTSLRRQYQKICDAFSIKRVDIMVFLTDADKRGWHEVQKDDRAKFPPECLDRAIHGVADRNIECWLCAEPGWLGKRLGMKLPHEIVIFAIEVKDVASFGEECTPEVEKAIDVARDRVIRELDNA